MYWVMHLSFSVAGKDDAKVIFLSSSNSIFADVYGTGTVFKEIMKGNWFFLQYFHAG